MASFQASAVIAELPMARIIDRGWPGYAYLPPPNDDFYVNYRPVKSQIAPIIVGVTEIVEPGFVLDRRARLLLSARDIEHETEQLPAHVCNRRFARRDGARVDIHQIVPAPRQIRTRRDLDDRSGCEARSGTDCRCKGSRVAAERAPVPSPTLEDPEQRESFQSVTTRSVFPSDRRHAAA